jgi:phage shock protein PspC (stress-responsive transcriptional regulator)
MNKTIIININGIVFHIEEDAYEILKSYMTDVKRHFMNSADSLEITTDIENRVAEMFSEILTRENKQVIVDQDVREVIEQMGTVEDFRQDDDDNDPAADNNHGYANSGARTLFRDPDDYLIGGVCAGLANYFNMEATWVRLIFALGIIFGGTGFLLYIILWVVVPKAVTRTDRMAMRGQKLNLQGFKNNFEEELNSVRDHLSNLQEEARPLAYKVRDFSGGFFHHLGQFFNGAGKVLVKLVGIIILLFCFVAAIALVVCLAMAIVWGQNPVHLFPFSVIGNHYSHKIYVSAFIVAIIPILAIILSTLKAIFNTHTVGTSTSSVILIVWIFALGSLIFYASKVSAGFRVRAGFSQTISLQPSTRNIYYLKLNDIKYFTHEDSIRLNIKSNFQNMTVTNDDNSDDNNEPDNVTITIEKSDVDKPVLIESFHSRGRNYDDALFNARNTRYIFTQQDSVLKFDRNLQREDNGQWHEQEIELTLKMPLNSTLVVDNDINRYIRNTMDIESCNEINKHPDAKSATFTITPDGPACKVDTLLKPTATIKPDSGKTTAKAKK